ncbi:O-antigen ligase family protein [Aurantibacillus circumpalustris]|uniref:O-antigen ligase family protein n=1 Tax=Aurantibacillus circumpalustris TaxID=3036359 RepID=UPI00295A6AF0|nr:O-antigen ligase family protein [Aurantibacillus circumpalustris]
MKNRSVINTFIFGIIFSSSLVFPFILDLTLLPRFISLGVSIALVFYFCLQSDLKFSLKLDFIFLAGAGYSIFAFTSILWATSKSESLFEASKQILFFFTFAFTYFFLKQSYDYFLKVLLKCSIALFLIIFLVVCFQLSELQNFNKDALYRITGVNGHKNLLASFLFLNLFFLIASFYKLKQPWSLLALACILLSTLLLIFLKTKAVWLGISVSVAVTVTLYLFINYFKVPLIKVKLPILLISVLVFTNVFFFVFLQPLIQKSESFTSNLEGGANATSNILKVEEERLVLWDKTYHLIRQKSLIGVGAGNWQTYLPDATLSGLWRGEELNYTFQRPHNDFLWILSELGFIGFNFYLLFLFGLIFSAIKILWLIPRDKWLRLDLILCIAFITGYAAISFFDFPKERIEHGLWISILYGMIYYHIKKYLPLKKFGEIRVNDVAVFASLLVLLGIVFTGIKRFNGEYYTRRMYNYKNSNQLPDLISSGNSAMSYAYSVDPTSIPIYWYTGNAKASMGNYKEAQQDFLKAYELAPYNKNVLNDLASSFVFTNEVLSAKKFYEEAARISPRFDEPKLNLAAMYINANDFKTATFWLNSLMHDSERRSNYEKIVGITREN